MRATIPENESHIFRYLYTVLLYMPDYKNEPAGIEKLLPWGDFIKERCSGLMLKIKHLNTMNQCLFIDHVRKLIGSPGSHIDAKTGMESLLAGVELGEGYQRGSGQYGGLFIAYRCLTY